MKNPDGTEYKAGGGVQQFNPNDPQLKLFDLWDQETIQASGSPIYYYEVFIPSGEIDTDYFESRGKLFSNFPITFYGLYEPIPAQNLMSGFGIDSMNEIVIECNTRALLNAIGHMPKIGSRIHTPHLGENWELIQRNFGEFKLWGSMRTSLICRQFQESVTTSNGRVTEKSPSIQKPFDI